MNSGVAFELLKIHLSHITLILINDIIYDCFSDVELGCVTLHCQRQRDLSIQ